MAGGEGRIVEVYRSGPLYLVRRGERGRLVNPASGQLYPEAAVQSIVAHSSVSEPWEPVPEADWPGAVRAAVDSLSAAD